jgi:hypothetical protein
MLSNIHLDDTRATHRGLRCVSFVGFFKATGIAMPYPLAITITILQHFLRINKSLQVKSEQLILNKTYPLKWRTTAELA